MTYLMRLNQINFGIITPEKDEPSGLNTYSAKHLCLLMFCDKLALQGPLCKFPCMWSKAGIKVLSSAD